jgi:glutaminyl-peptide cyclotransferase
VSRRARSFLAGLGAVAASLAIVACGDDSEPSDAAATDAFDAERAFADLEAQVEIGPRPSGTPAARRTARLVADGFERAGLSDVRIQRPLENVVATIPGEQAGTVVVGAHYDTKSGIPGFVGANDGASGVAVLLEVARSLPEVMPGPSVQLVAFDGEEARGDRPFDVDGKRGSRQYVADAEAGGRQGTPAIDEIRAMVLFDLVGDCDLEIPLEASSDPSLYEFFADAAENRTGDAAPFDGEAPPVDDDHISFIEAGVPAVDLIDFDFGPGPSPGAWWHTPQDTLDKVCPESLDAVGEAALGALPQIR